LGTWCFIDKHCFSFSDAWGVWPLLPMYTMASIFIYRSWIWTLHWDWDIWYPSRIFDIWWFCMVGILVISSRYFALVFLLSIMFRDAGTLFWLNEMLLENEHEVWGSFVTTRRTLYRTFVIIYFVLECKELWLFTFGW
jgi:hypothetical protein